MLVAALISPDGHPATLWRALLEERLPDASAPPPVTRGPDDDYLVALAATAGARALVSGDRDLIEMADADPPRSRRADRGASRYGQPWAWLSYLQFVDSPSLGAGPALSVDGHHRVRQERSTLVGGEPKKWL